MAGGGIFRIDPPPVQPTPRFTPGTPPPPPPPAGQPQPFPTTAQYAELVGSWQPLWLNTPQSAPAVTASAPPPVPPAVQVPYTQAPAAVLQAWLPPALPPPLPAKIATLAPAHTAPTGPAPIPAYVRRSWEAPDPQPVQLPPRAPIVAAPPVVPPPVPVSPPSAHLIRSWQPADPVPQLQRQPIAPLIRSIDRPPSYVAPNVAAAWLPVWTAPPSPARVAGLVPPPPAPVPPVLFRAQPASVLTSWAPAALQLPAPVRIAPLVPLASQPSPLPLWVVPVVTSWAPVWSPPPGLAHFPAFVYVPGPAGYAVCLAACDDSQVTLCGRAGSC